MKTWKVVLISYADYACHRRNLPVFSLEASPGARSDAAERRHADPEPGRPGGDADPTSRNILTT